MGILKGETKKEKAKIVAVLDIGSHFLKAMLLEVNRGERKGILRSWIKEKLNNGGIEEIYPICRKVINQIEKKAGLKAEQIFLGLSGDTLKGISATFCYQRENPKEKIDLPELKYFIQKVQWKAFDKIRKIFTLETGLPETEVKLIDAHIVNIKIDNGPIVNPLGFQGENLCLTIFNTYTSDKYLELLDNLVSRLGLELAGIVPLSYALAHYFDLEQSSKENILIIDIGGKITEITLIKNGGEAVETKSFNLGGDIFTKAVADFLGTEISEAETIKLKYSKKEISSGAGNRLKKLFESNIFSWIGGVKIVLEEFSKRYRTLPSKIFLCGGGSELPGMKENLKKKGKFQIKSIPFREVSKIENETKLQDVPCLALANLALKLPEATEFSSTLKRVIRLIQG
jgi:cell division protein FtsA